MGLRVSLVLEGEIGEDLVALAGGLVRRGLDVEAVCPPEVEDAFAEVGASVTPLAVGVGVSALSALRRLLREAGVDVIHAHGLRAGLIASLARPGGMPLVVGWPEPVPAGGASGLARRALARTVAAAADLTLTASTELATAATRLGAREARLAPVILPTLPEPRRVPAQVREELGMTGPMVLAVGRLHPRGHYDLLIAAAARWRQRQSSPQVVIVGTGPAYRELVGQAAVSRAPVIFVGDRDDLADLLGAADIAVVTEDRERPPFALQAARAGVALVSVSGAGMLDLLGGHGAAFVPRGDIDALDDAVRGLLDDAPARAALGEAGRARARTWPSVAEAVGEIASWYAEVSAAGPDAPTGGG